MGYNASDYKELFPKGLFEYGAKPLEDFFESHRLFALNMTPQPETSDVVAPGLAVKTGHLTQGAGFSNYFIFEIDPTVRKIKVEYLEEKMLYPVEAFAALPHPLLVTNGGYFYLTDDETKDPCKPPRVRTGNLLINNGKLFNLPILDRSAIIIYKDGHLDFSFLKAGGNGEVNGQAFTWRGSKSLSVKNADFTIYNSSNIEIGIINDPVMGPSRRAKKVEIVPNPGQKLFICERTDGYFKVAAVSEEPVLINDKDLVLEGTGDLKVTDKINFLTVDTLSLNEVDSAISAGPSMFPESGRTCEQVEKEFSVSDMANPVNPHETTKKLARGGIIKLKDGKVVIILVDGIPQAGETYPGVTLSEFNDFVTEKYPDFVSGVATDPSSSMKAVYLKEDKVEVFGNLHYLAHKSDANGKIDFWPNGRNGRKLNSVIAVY